MSSPSWSRKSSRAYDQFEFHVVYQKVSQFVAVELSAIYHDVVKDRLYTDAANSPRRRSTQTALHRMFVGLCKMLAPILAFTADEAWEFVPGKTGRLGPSARLAADGLQRPEAGAEPPGRPCSSCANWRCRSWRKARQAKEIGKALEAKLTFSGASQSLPGSPGAIRTRCASC